MAKPKQNTVAAVNRPMPPKDIGSHQSGWQSTMPATDMIQWVKDTFLEPRSKLFNNDHYHLYDFMEGSIQFLWAASGFSKQMKYVIGQTELLMFRMGGFQKMRAEQQFTQWFGFVPEFIITLDASYCIECTDIEFCALVEHELYHIGHEKDEFGVPKFSRDSGLPKLCMRDHDVSEFVGVVERYGTGDIESALSRLVRAGISQPILQNTDVAHACGTCLRMVT